MSSTPRFRFLMMMAFMASLTACAKGTVPSASGGGGDGRGSPGPASGAGGGSTGSFGSVASAGGGPPGMTCQPCSDDFTKVLNCDGTVKETCPSNQLCGSPGVCMAPCDAASANKSSVGCDYYAVSMDALEAGFGGCFVAFVANTWNAPVHIQASYKTPIDLAAHAAIPIGTGTNITYQPYDPVAGLAPGQVAILFLANDPVPHGTWQAPAKCPVPAAIGLDANVHDSVNISTGRSGAFHITTDEPVVSYQMLPYNSAYAATTGATLLLPTSAWDTNYIAVEAYRAATWQGISLPSSMSIVAKEDATNVTILPKVAIKAGILVNATAANQPITYQLNAGARIEFIQDEELTGSPISSDKPIGVFAGHLGMRIPYDQDFSDHAEQQIPPVRALGSEYAVASYRDRVPGITENRLHRIVGAVNGTTLTFDPPIEGAPSAVNLGDVVEFHTDVPFVVKSQDDKHPFLSFTYMSGSSSLTAKGAPPGYGDPDFLRIVPGKQYLSRYVFFTDPTYPETNLVVVRRKTANGFADVNLDCLGTVTGFQPIGALGDYEVARVDLSRHNFVAQGNCNNGRHEMTSTAPFGLFVWGWGSPETRPNAQNPCDDTQPDNSCDVSYSYPAGENVHPINNVVIPVTPM